MALNEVDRQQVLDGEHLRLLTLFHYISGGLTVLASSMLTVHTAMMGYIAANADKFLAKFGDNANAVPAGIFIAIAVVLGMFVILGITYGVAQIYSGHLISKGKHRSFSLVVAVPNLLFLPYGTVLGVMTLVVLNRESVKQRYLAQGEVN